MMRFKTGIRKIVFLGFILIFTGLVPVRGVTSKELHNVSERAQSGFQIIPENSLIISNAGDAGYCKDFSTLLKWSALDWLILDNPSIPETVMDKHLLLIASPDSQYTGDILTQLITREELDQIRGAGQPVVLKKANPWYENRLIMIASGPDMDSTRKAAEQALAGLMEGANDLSVWYADPYESVTRDEAAGYMQDIQHKAQGEELAKDMLALDLKVRTPLRISQDKAREDVERFFYLLEYGWCGYGYFARQNDFAQTQENILEALSAKTSWSPKSLSELIYQHMDFVHDCHLRLGDHAFCRHLDFWYDSSLDITGTSGAYTVTLEGEDFELLSVNDLPPDEYLFPSLNAEGRAVYRLGILSYDPPGVLTLVVKNGDVMQQLEVKLSSEEYYSDEIFGEERMGGIPVIRVRSFGDYYRGRELDEFLESANRYRGEPYLILDLRQNSGGNTDWPKNWVTRFTGHMPAFALMRSELNNRTTMMGRLNAFELSLLYSSDESSSWVQSQINVYRRRAERYDDPSVEMTWSAIQFPSMNWIPNATTLIVLMDRKVASAGEGMILYLYGQVQNVIFVGENSYGALTFGQVSNHRLPNSKLMVTLPIKLNVSQDLIFREERGYEPDLWVPAPQALNYAVAAARNRTISTQIDLPDGYFTPEFMPEKVVSNELAASLLRLRWMLVLIAVGAISLVVFRNIPRFYIVLGILCLPTSAAMIAKDNPQGFWLVFYGLVLVVLGIYKIRRAKNQLQELPE